MKSLFRIYNKTQNTYWTGNNWMSDKSKAFTTANEGYIATLLFGMKDTSNDEIEYQIVGREIPVGR